MDDNKKYKLEVMWYLYCFPAEIR